MKENSLCTSEDYLAEIKARCEAATPGPWVDRLRDFECLDGYGLESHPTVETNGKTVCVLCEREFDDDNDEADAVFIAHARQDIPDLLAEVERLRKRAERLRAGVKSLKSTRDFLVSNLANRIGEEKFDEMRRDALIKKLFDAGVCAGDPDCRQVGKKKRDYDSEESGCYSCWLLWSDAMARNECEKCEEDESA